MAEQPQNYSNMLKSMKRLIEVGRNGTAQEIYEALRCHSENPKPTDKEGAEPNIPSAFQSWTTGTIREFLEVIEGYAEERGKLGRLGIKQEKE